MKKILSLITIALMLISLVACGTNSSTEDKNGNDYDWEQLEWPSYDNAKQIPIPKSTTADIRNCHDIRFEFYVANTTMEDYKTYVEECKTKGFTIDAIEQENRYFAHNEGKYELTVQYHDGDIMYVEVVEYRCEVEIKLLHTTQASANRYNIRIEIDGGWEDDGEKGKEAVTFDSLLKEGQHTLIIENDDDDDINGRIDFVVTEDGQYLEFEIFCSDSKIEIIQTVGNSQPVEDEESKDTDVEIGVVENIHTVADIPSELMNDEFKSVIDLFSKGFSQSGLNVSDATTYDDGETYLFYFDGLEFLGEEPEDGYYRPRVSYSKDAINNNGVPDMLYFAFSYPKKSNGYKETVEMVEDIAEALNISDAGLIDNDYSSSSKWATGEYATFTFPNLNLKLTVSNMQSSVEIEIITIK